MRIKTQFIICIIAFTIVLIMIAASIVNTEQQTAYLANQQVISGNIERGASSLNSVSIDYFLYQEDLQLSKWNSTLSSLSGDLQSLDVKGDQQQTLAGNVAEDFQNLNAQFEEVATYLQNSPRNVSVRIDPAFQFRWSNMALQSQTLASDASQLSQSISDQVHQTNFTSTLLILSLVGTFGAFLLTIYLLVFRRTLKSVAGLQKGISTIGSGNLDYKIEIQGQNEITELSSSFNKMTSDLKNVTASKTELERAQVLLRESEQRWATTLSSIGDAVIATDTSGKVIFMNGVAEELTGWTLNEASMKGLKEVFKIVNEQTRLDVENPVDRVLKEGLIVGLANHTVLIQKNGAEVPIDDSGAPIKDKDSKATGVVLIFRDITERKKAEKALEESEHLHRQIFDNSQDGFQLVELIYDNNKVVDFKFLNVNSAYERQTGLKADFVVGKRAKEFAPDLEQYWFEAYEQVDKTSTPMHMVNYNQSLKRWFDVYQFSYAKGKIGSLFNDITERKKLEKQLQDSERLAAIGATAGMVGHDIRNPLQAITSDVYLAKVELASVPDAECKTNALESLTEIEKNIEYINKIVADLQDYARPLNPRAQETEVKSIIDEILAKNGVPKEIKVEVKVEENANKIMADSDYLKRIFANLTLNAVQAMPNGGKLTIRAFTDKKTNDILITVKDTGIGIPEDVKPKLFTPMMTTKSKGQGFGLAVVKRMTEGLGGTVTFESEEGKGTTFTVRLPPKS